MAIKYPSLYNANLSGAVAGMLSGRGAVDPSTADYQGVFTVAQAFATEFDTLLTNAVLPAYFAGLISAAGVTQVPATAAEANAAESLPVLFGLLTKAAWEGRSSADTVAADWSNLAGVLLNQALAAVALFTET